MHEQDEHLERIVREVVEHILADDHFLEKISTAAADKFEQRLYQKVGQSVIRKAAWAVGIALIGLVSWLAGAGHLK